MMLQLSSDHLLEYDGMGYTLKTLDLATDRKTGEVELVWRTEGHYGNIQQAIQGAWRHKMNSDAIETLERLESESKRFLDEVMQTIREGK